MGSVMSAVIAAVWIHAYSVVKAVYCFDLMWLTFKRLLTSKKKLLCFTKPWGSLAISHAEINFFKGYNAVYTHGSLLLCWGGQETVGGSTTDLLHVANCTVWLYCFSVSYCGVQGGVNFLQEVQLRFHKPRQVSICAALYHIFGLYWIHMHTVY